MRRSHSWCATNTNGLRGVLVATVLALAKEPLSAQTVRDSGGVVLRTYAPDARPPRQWSVDPRPVASIGGADGAGPFEFSGVQGVAIASSARLVVGDGGSNELRVFDFSGKHLRNIGRRGGGPGEFDRLFRFSHLADTLFVLDYAGRVTSFVPDGTLLRVRTRPVLPDAALALWTGQLSSRRAAFVSQGPIAPAPGTDLGHVSLLIEENESVRKVAELPSGQLVRRGTRYVSVFLGATGRMTVSRFGICLMVSNEWAVTCYDSTGVARWRTTKPVAVERLTEHDKEVARDGLRRTNLRSVPAARVDSMVRAMAFAELQPVVSRIERSDRGEVWLSHYELSDFALLGRPGLGTPSGPTHWSVFDAKGAWQADITLPARFRLMDVSGDLLAGIERDAEDVERVVVYKLRR